MQWRQRECLAQAGEWSADVHPVLRRVYAARGILHPHQVAHRLVHLLPPEGLSGMQAAVQLLQQAITENWRIVIAGDYDCDGATGVAVALRGLRMLGATQLDFAMPNRFVHGYGLTPALVDAMQPRPQLIVTADNGVASIAGVAHARELGIRVIVTDHHLPGVQLPAADAIVNPNLSDEAFPSKALAGVGVMFYLLLALRARLYPVGAQKGAVDDDARRMDVDHRATQKTWARPDLSSLLDLVALGTVADLVPLDYNNRILVEAGLRRVRSGQGNPGIVALLACGKSSAQRARASDLAFAVAPRLNAAGRMDDMRLGVRCLLSDDPAYARHCAEQLHVINKERRELQSAMIAEAELIAQANVATDAVGVVLYEPGWHAGVIGLVASKLKERLHCPVIALAPASEDATDELRGSGRSIPGFHLRDALALVDAREPGLIERFGGHAMAAGLSLKACNAERFARAFDSVAREWLDQASLQQWVLTDGSLPAGEFSLALAGQLQAGGPWGQGFAEPVFDNCFECVQVRVLGGSHLRLQLRDPRDGSIYPAVQFNAPVLQPPAVIRAAFELSINEWQGRESVQLLVRHMEPA